MTRKDFQLIADAMKATRPVDSSDPDAAWEDMVLHMSQQWVRDCNALCAALKQTNPNFDTNRFLTACGLTRNERIGSFLSSGGFDGDSN